MLNNRTMHSHPQSEAELAASMALVPCQHCGRPGGEHAIGCFALLEKQNHCQRSTEAVPIEEFFDGPFVAEDAADDSESTAHYPHELPNDLQKPTPLEQTVRDSYTAEDFYHPTKPQRLEDGGFAVTASEQVDKITKLREVAQRAHAKYADKAIRLEPVSNQTQYIYKLCTRPKQLQPTTEDLGANNWTTVVGGSLDEILDWLNSH